MLFIRIDRNLLDYIGSDAKLMHPPSTHAMFRPCQFSWSDISDSFLVGFCRSLVLVLVQLVAGSIHSSGGTAGERGVASVALHLLLVGLLGCLLCVALDGLRDVVGGVLDGVGGLAEDTLIWLIDVGSRHDD